MIVPAILLTVTGLMLLLMAAADRVYFNNLIASVAAIAVAIIVYFAVLIKIGGLTREDLLQVPKGAKVVGVLQKIRLM